jgi:hypothetical protein
LNWRMILSPNRSHFGGSCANEMARQRRNYPISTSPVNALSI